LDIIADMMSARAKALSATHVGSPAGLMALARGECHIAPIHLLDEETGEYNIAVIKKFFSGVPMSLIKGLRRAQGLIVKKGNPLGLHALEQLRECSFINRQRGSGTRVLLDYKLREAGIEGAQIKGYDREAPTHMAVAAAVQSGGADAGMGIAAAAEALGLGFVPIGAEEYDFAIPSRFLSLPQAALFIETLRSEAFKQRLSSLAGYTAGRCGEIVDVS
ncbi:MAG: hypothetical protein FWE09_09980, partial [Treponema sp.]|nr:hypothetical protein [Treponema sp.]